MNTYIRQNDDGRASTVTRMNIPKSSPIFRLLGALDECSAALTVAKLHAPALSDMIDRVCQDLEAVAGEVAGVGRFVDQKQIDRLTEAIATLRQELPQTAEMTANRTQNQKRFLLHFQKLLQFLQSISVHSFAEHIRHLEYYRIQHRFCHRIDIGPFDLIKS